MNRKFLIPALYATAIALLAALGFTCREADKTSKPPCVSVVVTTSILKDTIGNMVKGIKNVKIESLMGLDVDPHSYQPTLQDGRKIDQAAIIFHHGLHLEGKLHAVLESLGKPATHHTRVINVANVLEEKHLIKDDQGIYDPHIWCDVNNWIVVVRHCLDKLKLELRSKLNKDAIKLLEANTKQYIQTLAELDEYIRSEKVKALGIVERWLVTSHDAFAYFAKAYGFKVRSLQGISTTANFGLKDVDELANFIMTENIPVIFTENAIPQQYLKAVVEKCQQHGHPGPQIGQPLYADALGRETATTYQEMMSHNIESIIQGHQTLSK